MKSQAAETNKALPVSVGIIGGGAAGLTAAVFAAAGGAKVTLFEKNKSQKSLESERYFDNCYLGKKLLITGKGRCNLTNDCTLEEFLANVPKNPKFLFSSFGFFSPQKVMEFFEDAGVALKVERGRRVFPVSDSSKDILNALKRKCREHGVCFLNLKAERLDFSEESGFITCNDGKQYSFDYVILATGGKSYPVTGSDGQGYELAKSLGHTITEIMPSLVPIETKSEIFHDISGLSLKNVTLKLYENGKKKPIYSELGEMLFTHFGVSGPLVLSASAYMRKKDISSYSMFVDLKPGLDREKLDNRILSDFAQFQNKNLENALVKLLPQSLIKPLLRCANLDGDIKVNSLTRPQREILVNTIKALPIDICGKRPIDEAIITSGGVKVSEINPSTMASKLCERLYFAGEIIDTDGFTGGYNLQIAFCTGALAGKSCASASK